MLELFGIHHTGSYSLPVKQVKEKKTVTPGGFHDTVMSGYGKRADKTLDPFYGIVVSTGLISEK